MDHASHNKIVSFIWSIADDCLRDVFVLRLIDGLLEDRKEAVLAEVAFQKDEAKLPSRDRVSFREQILSFSN